MDNITIYLPNGKTLLDAPLTDKAQRNATLMTDNSVTLQWYSELGPYLPALSYMEWGGVRFILPEDYTPAYSGGIYDYQPKFLAREYALSAPLFCRYITITDQAAGDTAEWEEASFSVNANLATMAQMIETAISRCGLYAEKEFTLPVIKDAADPSRDYLSTPALPFSFEGVSILEAITQVASAFSREWWVEDDCRLYFTKCERKGDPIPMGDIVTEADFALSRCETASSSSSCPRYLKVYGSDRNITPRKAQANGMNIEFLNRLRLDNDQSIDPSSAVARYVRVLPDSRLEFIGVNNLRTELFIDENIYPRYTGTVHSVITKDNGKTDPAERRTYYTIIDSNPSFPATIEKVTDENRRLVFTSGNLNGLEFDFNYNPANKEITIISNSDNGGILLPTEAMCPKIGDTFVMFNIRMDDTYIATAKAELLAKATLRCAELLDHIPSVRCTSDDLAFADRRIELQLGTPVILHTPSVRPSASATSHVQSISYPLTRPTSVTFLLSNTYLRGRLDQLRDQIRQAEDAQRPLVERAKRISDDGIVSHEERAALRVMESQITARAKEIQDRCRQNDIDHAGYLTALGNVLSLLDPILSSEGDCPINRTEFDTIFSAYNQAEQSITTTLALVSEPNIISTDPDDWETGGFNAGTGQTWGYYKLGTQSAIRLTVPVSNSSKPLSLKKWYKSTAQDHIIRILILNDKWQVVENLTLAKGNPLATYTTPEAFAFIISVTLHTDEDKKQALASLALRGMRAYKAYPPFHLTPDFRIGQAIVSAQQDTSLLRTDLDIVGQATKDAADTAKSALTTAQSAVTPTQLSTALTPYVKTTQITGEWITVDLSPAGGYREDTFYPIAFNATSNLLFDIIIKADFWQSGQPSWGRSSSDTARGHFTAKCQWQDSPSAAGQWRREHYVSHISHSDIPSDVSPFANIGQQSPKGDTSVMHIYARGGGIYQFRARTGADYIRPSDLRFSSSPVTINTVTLSPLALGEQTPVSTDLASAISPLQSALSAKADKSLLDNLSIAVKNIEREDFLKITPENFVRYSSEITLTSFGKLTLVDFSKTPAKVDLNGYNGYYPSSITKEVTVINSKTNVTNYIYSTEPQTEIYNPLVGGSYSLSNPIKRDMRYIMRSFSVTQTIAGSPRCTAYIHYTTERQNC